jgi:flagellar biosynthetic protein FliR
MINLGDLSIFGIIFCRMMASIVSLPLLGSQYVPMRLKVCFGLTLSMMVFDAQTLKTTPLEGQWFYFLSNLFTQFMVGLGIGFLVHACWEIFMMLGNIISQQSGLSFATFIDPALGMNMPILSQLYVLLLNLVFLSIDGHLAIISCIIESFQTIPLDCKGPLNLGVLFSSLAWIFSKSLQIALPSIATLGIVNMAFGIMARVAPQLNIFSIGFTLSLLSALMIVWVTLFWADRPIEKVFSDTLKAVCVYTGGDAPHGREK